MKRIDRLADVLVLVTCDVAAAAVAQRQDGRYVTGRSILPEVASHEPTQILRQRHTEFRGPQPRPAMLLRIQARPGSNPRLSWHRISIARRDEWHRAVCESAWTAGGTPR